MKSELCFWLQPFTWKKLRLSERWLEINTSFRFWLVHTTATHTRWKKHNKHASLFRPTAGGSLLTLFSDVVKRRTQKNNGWWGDEANVKSVDKQIKKEMWKNKWRKETRGREDRWSEGLFQRWFMWFSKCDYQMKSVVYVAFFAPERFAWGGLTGSVSNTLKATVSLTISVVRLV